MSDDQPSSPRSADVPVHRSADVPVRPGHGDVPVTIANEKAIEQAASAPPSSTPALADEDIRALRANGDVRAPADAAHHAPTREWHSRGYLPHRDRLHLLQSITFRLADSLPQTELKQLAQQLFLLPEARRDAMKRKRIEEILDAGMGCCALAHPEAAACVRDALHHFDGTRYRIIAWVVMPNHVHVLIDPAQPISKTIQAWKSYTARWLLANNVRLHLGIPDPRRVWMPDYWDRFIRDADHLESAIQYIHDNPVKARLCSVAADWPWSSRSADDHVRRSADDHVRPGHGDVPVAIANEKAKVTAARDSPLSNPALADEDVRDPGADGDVRAPADGDVRAPADADLRAATLARIRALIAGETDAIAIMATIACELHHADPRFDWTGFYRVTKPGMLKIGPYQGGHGCLVIPFSRGVCGRCAREGKTQLVDDVNAVPDHIACSSTTRSEIVVPVIDINGEIRAVLDIDSNQPAAFTAADAAFLATVCGLLRDAVSVVNPATT